MASLLWAVLVMTAKWQAVVVSIFPELKGLVKVGKANTIHTHQVFHKHFKVVHAKGAQPQSDC